MMNSIFIFILTTSLYASVVGIVILILKAVLKNKLNPKWHYMIWIILIIKMLIPFGPESSVSIFNTVPQITQQNNFTQIYREYHESETLVNNENQNLPHELSIQESLLYLAAKVETTLPYIWVVGASFMLGWVLYTKYSLINKIKKSSFTVPESINDIFEECKGKMKIQKDIKIIIQNVIFTPSLFGVFKPKILISPLILQLSEKDISYVLLHELAHFKRKDIQVNQLLLILQIIHWFNPVIWYCFKKIRQDMEIAADEIVLSLLESGQQNQYGMALLSVIENYSYPRLAPRLIGLFDGKKDIERRLKMIKMAELFKRKKKNILVLSIVCILFLSVIFLTNSLAIVTIGSNVTADVEDVVSNAIEAQCKHYTGDSYEFSAESHIILGSEEKNGKLHIYMITSYHSYQFQDGLFRLASGSSKIPTAITLSLNEQGKYLIEEYKEALDGSKYSKSIRNMFPKILVQKVYTSSQYVGTTLSKQIDDKAKQYLKDIGRNTNIGSINSQTEKNKLPISRQVQPDLEKVICSEGFPNWVGSFEKIENSIRYIYETSHSKTDDGFILISCKKINEDGIVIKEIQYKIIGNNYQRID